MSSAHAALVAAGCCLALANTPAHASPPWADPQPLNGAHLAAWTQTAGLTLSMAPAEFGFTPGGTGFAVLGRDAGGLGYTRFAGSRGVFGAVTSSTFRRVIPTAMALHGQSGVYLAGGADAPSDQRGPGGSPLDAAVTRGNVTGDFPSRQVLARGFVPKPGALADPGAAVVTALASNAGGVAAVAVSVPEIGTTRIVGYRSRLFIRGRGQNLFRRTLDYGRRTVGSSPSALAVNASGDILLAWDDRQDVRARLITANGRIGSEQRLGIGGSAFLGPRFTRISASIDDRRRMLVGWLAQRAGSSGNAGGPGIFAAAEAAPGKSFGSQLTLESQLPQGDNALITGVAVQTAITGGRAVVLWTGNDRRKSIVRAADVAAGSVRGRQSLSAAGQASRLQGLAIGRDGHAVAVWTTRGAGLLAATRAAGAKGWGAAETVSPSVDETGMTNALVAASPVSTEAVVVASGPIPLGSPPLVAPVAAQSVVRLGIGAQAG